MKFTCERAELHMAIGIVSKAASNRSPIPALEGILLETQTEGLSLTAYDLKKAIYTGISADVQEQGSIVLNAKIFGNIVSALPEGTVHITAEDTKVSIVCRSAQFNLIGMDSADYPELPEVEGSSGVSLPQDLLGRMIRQTIFAVSDNESRPVYTGEMFEISGSTLTVSAVDGYRLAMRREKVEGIEDEHSFIVPGAALSDVEKLCGDEDEPVYIRLGSKHISFTLGSTVLLTRRLEGEFLNYKKAVPEDLNCRVTAARTTLQRTIERVSLVIDDRVKNPLRCTFGDGEIRIVCATAVGKAEDSCPVEGSGEDIEIGFNNRYLLDALRAAPADEVMISLKSGTTPATIRPADENDDSFLYMILPVRLRASV